MRGLRIGVLAAAMAVLVWLFGFGGMSDIVVWAADQQRTALTALAQGLRAVRAAGMNV